MSEPNERDREIAKLMRVGVVVLEQEIARYREEIAAQARREPDPQVAELLHDAYSARDVAEADLATARRLLERWVGPQPEYSVGHDTRAFLAAQPEAEPAIAEPPEPATAGPTCALCGNLIYSHCLREREGKTCRNTRGSCHAASYSCSAPEPPPALPLGHEFLPCDGSVGGCDNHGCHYHHGINRSCGQPESAHRPR